MTKADYENDIDLQSSTAQSGPGNALDAGGRSLSDALRISFIILQVIMVILVLVFLASGFRTIGPDEQALVLRFGKIRGVGENRILEPGLVGPLPWLHWVFPYPIDKVVKIPVGKKPNLPIDSFWYYEKPSDKLPQGTKRKKPPPPTLNPLIDGYCITRGEKQTRAITGSAGSDYNIVHCKWQLIYQIDEPERFFKNVYVEDVKPGEIYFDIIRRSITPLLKALVDDTVVTTMVNYTIDEARSSDERIARDVKRQLREKLAKIESGISVVSVQLTDIIWPRQVDAAFQDSITASQLNRQLISQAKLYAEKTLNETAGPVAEKLLVALEDETVSEKQKELLWSQLAGSAQQKIAKALAYRTKVVETAKANAEYMQQLLPEYRKRPKLVIQKIYQDAIEYVFDNVDEKMIVQPTETTKGKEIRILLNRDPTIKPKSEEE